LESFFDVFEDFLFRVALYYQVVDINFQVSTNFFQMLCLQAAVCDVDTHPPTVIVFLYHHWVREPAMSSILPISDRLPPIVTICSGFSGCIATFIPSATASSLGEAYLGLLPPFCILLIFLRPGRPMILSYGDGYLTTIKFIRAFVECSPSPMDTISDICPKGQDISPLNPKSGFVA
ncbi:hypothetical protein Tco_1139066, partial [Tanacetum coccineum]